MGVAERKGRERAEREHRITAAARRIAATEGWSAVTIRRLAAEIEYSQPVLYAHFKNRDAIVAAVAIEGFGELATALQHASVGADDVFDRLHNVALAYLAFARDHATLYEAMFTLPTHLQFAEGTTRSELKDAFAALAAVVPSSQNDLDVVTETLWAALHGLAALEHSGRIRTATRHARVVLLVQAMLGTDGPVPPAEAQPSARA